jgi:hypothetical protein
MTSIPSRLRFFLGHLAISAVVIAAFIAFVLLVWYPGAFAKFEGVYDVLIVMAIVDVGAGPLCTLVAASPNKSRSHLARDLAVIGAVQLLALGYATYTTGSARPAYIVFSFGQFDVEHANQLSAQELAAAASTPFSSAPLTGPVFVQARLPSDKKEADRIIVQTGTGKNALKDMPRYYRSWPDNPDEVRKWSRPVPILWEKGELRPAVDALLEEKGIAESDAIAVRMYGQTQTGTVVLRKDDLSVIGIIPGLMF